MQTKSDDGTTAKDSFLTITQAVKKLGVSAHRYICDRVSKTFDMLALSELILQNALPQIEYLTFLNLSKSQNVLEDEL